MAYSSEFQQFDVNYYENGVLVEMLATKTVHVYNATLGAALDDVISNGEGIVEAGTLPVAAGTVVRFYTDHMGAAGALEQVTT